MRYRVDYLSDKKIVDVKMRGRINYQIAESFSKDAIKIGREHDCTRFLINHEDTFIIFRVTNLFATGSELQQFGFKKSDKIAIVMQEVSSYKNATESENGNANWSKLRYFNSEGFDDALTWLMKD